MNAVVQERSGTRWLIVGAGAFGRECAEWIIRQRHCADRTITFLDDVAPPGSLVAGRWLVFGPIDGNALPQTSGHHRVVVAVSSPEGRKNVVKRLGKNHTFTRFETDMVASTAKRGKGLFMCPGAAISAGAEIGTHCHMNLHAKVGHDVLLGDYCTLACDVDLMGGVRAGSEVLFGSGCRVLPGVIIGNSVVIGAGAVVMSNVPSGATVSGNPARRV